MTRQGSAQAAIVLYDGYDIRGQTTEYDLAVESPVEDTTVLGITDITQEPVGYVGATLDLKGFYDDAAGAINQALVGVATEGVLCLGVEGNALGKRFFGATSGIGFAYKRLVKVGGLHRAEAQFVCSGAFDDGDGARILYPLQTITAAVAGSTALDGGASSSGGGAGYLQVPALTLGGYTSVTVAIQDSADGATGWATIATFTAVTAAPAAQAVAIAGTIRRYTRVTVTLNGAGSGPSITLFVGLARR